MAIRHQIGSLSQRAASDPAIEPGASAPPGDQHAVTDQRGEADWDADAQLPPPSPSRWPLALAALMVAGWTGFYGWAMGSQWASIAADPRSLAPMIAEWAVPVLLVGVVWLIALRHSRAEAARFADSAALLRQESAALEQRLTIVNRELSLAREFLAAQSQDLESLGRIAAEKISRHASELQSLIQHNDAQVSAIAATSESALGNMNLLRDNLPVVANAARDATNQIGNAGRTASEQVERLIHAFERLNQFGSASEVQVASLEARLGETLRAFDKQVADINAVLTDRFAALQGDVAASSVQVTALEQAALSALEQRIAALMAEVAHYDATIARRSSAFEEQLEQRQAAFETRETQASEVLAHRLAELDDALAQRREAQVAETARLVAHSTDMASQLDALGELIGRIQQASAAARGELGDGLNALGEQLAAKQQALAVTQGELAAITDASVRLLEIIQSGARFAREDLADSIAGAASQLGAAEAQAAEVHGLMLGSTASGAALEAYLIRTRESIAAADTAIRELDAQFATASEDALARLQGLRGGFARLCDDSGTLAETSQEALRASLAAITSSITDSLAELDRVSAERLPALAEGMAADAVAALERALRNEAAATIGKLEQSASHAAGIGREAVVQLRDQLAMVNELTGNLEQRVARARELAEEQVNNDFARRMALITDSLNSAAIDITNALSTEVSDTAWEAYLKGDRGIFTRRAVRLVDNATAREITEMYQNDEAFRGHVSRYIHDFEAMLRSLLSARNGNVMSVTMLGSDMGKLYVVLAQAIQRLRA